jgi:phosphoglucosamine mutase
MTLPLQPHRRLFGTDGIRAPFGAPPLDRPTVYALGAELAARLAVTRVADRKPQVILGGDTRESTPVLCRWLAAGLAAGGAETVYVGVMPTPGIAFLTRSGDADAGISVSASHNPCPDNGIKLLDRGGWKWSLEDEADLEERIAQRLAGAGAATEDGDEPPLAVDRTAGARYLGMIASSLPGARPLAGLSMVLDPGHGAASPLAGPLFTELGAEVTQIGNRPDGTNINLGCGSTAPQALASRVVEVGADLGVAFDGDADRALLVDELGLVHDGDAVLFLWATSLAAAGELSPPQVVVTSMSNLGLERALAHHGIGVVRCDVGDREVVATMRRRGIRLGGEQSGHLVHLGYSTTGDGLLTGLQMADLVRRRERPLSELVAPFERFPQVLVNVPVARKPPFAELPAVAAVAREVEESLGGDGRLVLRYSGTEPLARIMIEGPDQARIESLAGELASTLRRELGG